MLRPSETELWDVLDGQNPEAAEKVSIWLSSDEGLKWIAENTDRIIRHCEDIQHVLDVPTELMLENIHKQIGILKRKRRLRRFAMIAAAAIIPVVFVSLAWINVNRKLGNILITDPDTVCETAVMGERKVVVFQDGTKVYLNAGSTLSYPSFWSLSNRDVRLEGEGFFDVKKNPRRPFVVDLDGVSLSVYGTRFNVKAYPNEDEVDVILYDGEVVFEAGDKTYELEPSEQLEYSRSTGKTDITSLKSSDDKILWTKNVIMFKNDTLRDIAAVLSRWYDVTFEIEDELLYSRTFTLKTDHQPLHILLDEMEYVSDLHFELHGNIVKVTLKEQD